MGGLLQPLNGFALNRILIRLIRFTKTIFNVEFPIDIHDFFTLFFFGIIPPEDAGCTLFTDKVSVDARKIPRDFEAIHIYFLGFQAEKNLATSISMMKASTIGKHGIS